MRPNTAQPPSPGPSTTQAVAGAVLALSASRAQASGAMGRSISLAVMLTVAFSAEVAHSTLMRERSRSRNDLYT